MLEGADQSVERLRGLGCLLATAAWPVGAFGAVHGSRQQAAEPLAGAAR